MSGSNFNATLCHFSHNNASGSGGGVYTSISNLFMSHCHFFNNTAAGCKWRSTNGLYFHNVLYSEVSNNEQQSK